MNYRKGIDVSEHQGTIDWEKVKASGVEFAMLRGGYGMTVDLRFVRNVTECNRLGIPCGVYWFSYAMTAERAAQEAAFCLATIKPYRIDLPVAYDYEYDSVNYAQKKGLTVTKALASSFAKAFCKAVQAAGYRAVNYANVDYLNRYFDASVDFPLWLAQWPGSPNPANPPRTCEIWQYSEKGSVPGISGAVDLDACYVDWAAKKPEPEKTVPAVAAMTGEQIYKALTDYMKNQPLPDWAKDEFQEAVDAGITDGTNPGGLIPRYQAALMALRAAKK